MTPKAFREAIAASLAAPDLQAALDNNAELRAGARARARAEFDGNWEDLRQKAHAIRADTLAHLDAYVDQFITRAEDNGWNVHPVANQAEAIGAMMRIAQASHARLAAKSKTMLGEELELNHALEQAGVAVIETDLGEYIVQLRGERPAHITTPAVHLRREDVARTFHEKLGIPMTDQVPVLAEAARKVLRQTFFAAGLGISGVNFGIVETGGICLITNEGNGRMVTTLPRVHVALMGLERLVPTLQDLAVMLRLLPGAATGQRMTAYTSLINRPRRPDDGEGPEERHLILVDNGRRQLSVSPLADALLCIRCGACLNACPVFREIGGHAYVGRGGQPAVYPGPIGSILSPGLFGLQDFGQLARASSLCGACREACPVDIDLPSLLLRVRSGLGPNGNERPSEQAPFLVAWGLRAYAWLAADPRRFHLSQRLAGLMSRAIFRRSDWLRLPAITGWGFSKDLPRPRRRTFRDLWIGRLPDKSPPPPAGSAETAALFQEPIDAGRQAVSEDWAAKFAQRWIENGGNFRKCRLADLPGLVRQVLQERQADEVLTWEAAYLPPGLLAEVESAGCRVAHQLDEKARFGITGAAAAVAESGSLVLVAGPGRPQAPSLTTEVHLVVLRSRDIVPNLSEAFRLPEFDAAPVVTLISGPSRTADIELTLTIGVHGPREVHVFCTED